MNTRATDIIERAGRCTRASEHRSRRNRDRHGGFTLMELLVAIGALAFVAVGIAAIFEATGKTVRTGRRVSDFSAYAGLIQQQMRADLASMTRGGFLIIRHQYAHPDPALSQAVSVPDPPDPNNVNNVPLYDGDTAARLRRTDELLFFAKGPFTTLREPLHPEYIARADAAAIYYGHGERRINYDAAGNTVTSYRRPELEDNVGNGQGGADANARLGYLPSGGTVNPNRYASDWILVRRATLLRPPRTGAQTAPTPTPFGQSPQRLRDGDVQVSLQPACRSIFRALASVPTSTTPGQVPIRFGTGSDNPQLASGLVDIATTDLPEIRMIVTTPRIFPGPNITPAFYDPAANDPTVAETARAGLDGTYVQDNTVVSRQQAWMEDAMPAWSASLNSSTQTRVRCEPGPTDFVGETDQSSATYINSLLERAYRRADQMMLSASNFLPHCTEFIVEWSFGLTYTSNPQDPNYNAAHAGELVWYGLERSVNGERVAHFYQAPLYPWNQLKTVSYERVDGQVDSYVAGGAVDPVNLFHGISIPTQFGNPGMPLSSYFGYADPTFDPESPWPPGNPPPNTPDPAPHNGLLDQPYESRYPTVPWAWPRLIRVTLSLSDPNDPSIEQSFQFVFDVPQNQP